MIPWFVVSCGMQTARHKPQLSPKPTTGIPGSDNSASDEEFIDPADLNPYFAKMFDGQAAEALSQNRLADAFELFDEIAHKTSDMVLTPRARFIAAYLAEQLGDDARALSELSALADELPLLADTARERASRAAIRLGKCELAIELAAMVDDSSTLAPDVALLRADALQAIGRLDEALEIYESYLEKWPDGKRNREALARIIECQARRIENGETNDDVAIRALERLEQLKAQAPTSHWTDAAETHEKTFLAALGRKAPKKRQERRAVLAAYEKASKLMRKMRNQEAEKILSRVVRLARKGGELSCKARYDRAIVISRQREHERAAASFDEVSEKCTAPDIRIRALYRGAKAYQSSGLLREAIRLYGEVESFFPLHSFADDARLHAAKCRRTLGDRDGFVEMLESLPDTYPAGDMRGEALWTMAHDALKRNELVKAKEVLKKYYQQFPLETGWYASGRSGYWFGRITEKLGDTETAATRYEQVIAGSPLTFYMVLAYNRLAAINPNRARQLIDELAPVGDKLTARYPKSLLADFPRLAKGIELHRMGLVTQARREFDWLLAEPDLPLEIYWLTATLLRRAGRFHEAREFTARADDSWNQRYPAGRDFTYWTLAYPPAYEQEVTEASTQAGVQPALIWAVMREESGFNPNIESWANAIGLMQLIMPTARRMGRKLDVKVNRRTLRQPGVNIQLGTAYLAHLQGKFKGHPVLMVAGYNAGEGAVDRWLKTAYGKEIDRFVEEIPYDQTRGYTKRVIATLATYLFLYKHDHQVLELGLTLPKSLTRTMNH
ncbi:MAG: transglycosylase SLT domain-containing protein [Proteobacteria bacterium]|nr:transglycosylase SLT domain-containing protein [Pseudomonadota bacterium]